MATCHDEADVDLMPADRGNSFADMDRSSRLKAMQREIESAVSNLSSPDRWRAFLDATSKFHRYSFGNMMLIMHQRPNATFVAGFHDWKNKFNRTVKKGEKAIWVLAPCKYTKVYIDDDGNTDVDERVFFKPVPVFDISQTEGDPLPTPPRIESSDKRTEAPPGMNEALSKWVASKGYALKVDDLDDQSLYGRTNFAARTVTLNSMHNEAQRALTLAHEVAHIALGHDSCYKTKTEREIEAESVAYIIGRHFGLDDAGSFDYIDHHAFGNPQVVRKTAETVVRTTDQVLGELEKLQTEEATA